MLSPDASIGYFAYFSRCYPLTPQLAVKMTTWGYRKPSKFGSWCPVQLADGACLIPPPGYVVFLVTKTIAFLNRPLGRLLRSFARTTRSAALRSLAPFTGSLTHFPHSLAGLLLKKLNMCVHAVNTFHVKKRVFAVTRNTPIDLFRSSGRLSRFCSGLTCTSCRRRKRAIDSPKTRSPSSANIHPNQWSHSKWPSSDRQKPAKQHVRL